MTTERATAPAPHEAIGLNLKKWHSRRSASIFLRPTICTIKVDSSPRFTATAIHSQVFPIPANEPEHFIIMPRDVFVPRDAPTVNLSKCIFFSS